MVLSNATWLSLLTMLSFLEIGKLLAGIAFFLLAMDFMDKSLRQLAGRKFKLYLKRQTKKKLSAIAGGALVTALLQSSSIVNMLVLSMVGSGVLIMEGALVLILGANLGSTFNSWIVALFGFDYNIENLALPVIGITGMAMAFMSSERKLYSWLRFLFGLALLFLALGFIKNGMDEIVKQTDLSSFSHRPAILFLLMGILLTALVQTSSVTVALILAALHADVIDFYPATAMVLGSEIGTTLKLFIVSGAGMAVKKKVAVGNLVFNVVTVTILFILLKPVNYLILETLGFQNDLIALVFFQSFTNLSAIIFFLPFLDPLGKFLHRRFPDQNQGSVYIGKIPVADPDGALEALENETSLLIGDVMTFTLDSFDLKEPTVEKYGTHENFNRKQLSEKYEFIKQLHGEMHGYYLELQNRIKGNKDAERLERLVSAIRNTMYAAKSINDAQGDIQQMRNSSNDSKYEFYVQTRKLVATFYERVTYRTSEGDKNSFEKLMGVYELVTSGYSETLQDFYKKKLATTVSDVEISTLINFNREVYTSLKSMVFALKDYTLPLEQAANFDSMPGFIR
jgi:phosphate:Na+ symporter